MGGDMINLEVVDDDRTHRNFDEIQKQWPPEPTYRGTGVPNGAVTAGPGAQYINLATGQLWVHEAAVVSNLNWVLK